MTLVNDEMAAAGTEHSSDWHPTACVLCSVNCGLEVRIDGRLDHPCARRQGTSRIARLHVREGPAHRPLPERSAATHVAPASAPRRLVRGDRLGHGDRRGGGPLPGRDRRARRRQDPLLRRRRTGQSSRRRLRRVDASGARHPLLTRTPSPRRRPASSGSTGNCSAVRGATPPATTSTPRSPCSGARTRGSRTASRRPAGSSRRSPTIRRRTLIVVDPRRTETADLADIHLRPRPGRRRRSAGGTARRARRRAVARRPVAGRARQRARRGRRAPPRRSTSPPPASAPASTSTRCATRRA